MSSVEQSKPVAVEGRKLPKFPQDGFLKRSRGASSMFSSSSSSGEVGCGACSKNFKSEESSLLNAPAITVSDEDHYFVQFGDTQIVIDCCGILLDKLYEAGYIAENKKGEIGNLWGINELGNINEKTYSFTEEFIKAVENPEDKSSLPIIDKIQTIADELNSSKKS